MIDTDGSLFRRALASAWLILTLAVPVAAQQTPAPAPSDVDFFTRYDFHLTAESLNGNDQRFSWDTHFGGDLDLVDYVRGRAAVLIDYEAVLGSEFRAFDPNQSYYTLEASSSVRTGPAEVVGFFHHVSRHLGDRPKRFAIAWNTMGARVLSRLSTGGNTLDINVEGARIVAHAYVDYTWVGQADLVFRRPLNARTGLFVHSVGQLSGVDPTLAGRIRQTGGLVEAGVRVNGRAGTIELFAGYEKRIDADPLDRQSQHWGTAGFRLLGR